MVGIVIVSHSARLAEGVAEMAREMGGDGLRLATAGGLDLSGRPLGTDAELIRRAIEQVYSDEGVLVLVDLGSAVLSTEMALEELAPEHRVHVFLSDAPLVEGALAAAVQARLGSPVAQVLAEARGALAAKGLERPAGQVGPAPLPAESATANVRLTIHNRLGLHARPAARVVQTAYEFTQTNIQLKNLSTGRGPVDAKSITGITTLGVRQGHAIEISASGPEADAALRALASLAERGFDEPADAPPASSAQPAWDEQRPGDGTDALPYWQGLPASPGLALGPARWLRAAAPQAPAVLSANPPAEWQRLMNAIETTRQHIAEIRGVVAKGADTGAAEIFDAHSLYLADEALLGPSRQHIFHEQQDAASAWQQAVTDVVAACGALQDDYQRARAADVDAVGQQVLAVLQGAAPRTADWAKPGILVADDLSPAEAAQLDPHRVLGIVTAAGAPTSHSAILARGLGIPAVVGLRADLLSLAEGTPLLLDGAAGRVWPNPSPAQRAAFEQRTAAARAAQAAARAISVAPAITRDGRRIEVAANIGTAADAAPAVLLGAEGVGLFRTEFLFLDRQTAPDEDEQYAAYLATALGLAGRVLTIRTLDVGGDKPLPFLALPLEANPFLGQRGIRLCLARPEFFKVQLRAIVRVATDYPLRVMFPMIATLAEFRAARALLLEAKGEVERRGRPTPNMLEVGMMVEVPAAALQAEHFAAEVDFFSIGTNDLTQYTLAAERGNERVAGLADALQPAVLQLIHQTVAAAQTHGKRVSVCGELAGDPQAVALLVGLGVDELSLAAPAIPRVKEIVRTLDYGAVHAQALTALSLETPEAVRALFLNA